MSTAVATRILSPSERAQILERTVDFEDMIIYPEIFEKFDRNGNPVIWYVRSNRMPTHYYVVIWNYDRCSYQCSCGAGCKEHSHIEAVSAFNHAKQVEQKEAERMEAQEVLHIDALPVPNEQGRYQTAMDWLIATDAQEYKREEIDEDATYEAWKKEMGFDVPLSREAYDREFDPCGLEVA